MLWFVIAILIARVWMGFGGVFVLIGQDDLSNGLAGMRVGLWGMCWMVRVLGEGLC